MWMHRPLFLRGTAQGAGSIMMMERNKSSLWQCLTPVQANEGGYYGRTEIPNGVCRSYVNGRSR